MSSDDFTFEIDRGDGRTGTMTFNPPLEDGSHVWLTAKRRPTDLDADAVYALTTDNGKITLAPGGATAVVEFPASSTEGIGDRRVALTADVQVQEPGREPETVLHGCIIVRPDITRSVV
jgi:hypothetical protein